MIVPLIVPYAIVARATDAQLFYRAFAQKRYADAVAAGARHLKAHPSDDAFAFDLAYAYLDLGRLDDARRTVEKRDAFLRKHPQSASIWLALGYKDGDAKRYPEAIAEIDRYLRFRPGDAQARRQRDFNLAALHPVAEPSAQAAQPDESTLFYQAVNEKRFDEAVVQGQRYLSSHPENDAFAVDLAYALISDGKLEDAVAIADARAAYIRSHPETAGLLAALFYGLNERKSPKAVPYGEKYLELRPGDDAFAMDLAYAEIRLGELAAAREIVSARSAYLRDHPNAASIWLNFAYKEADAKRYHAAVDDVDAYLRFQPGDAAAKRQRGYYIDEIWSGPRFQSYGYGQYEGRFSDGFFGLDSRYTLAPGIVQPYLANHIVDDVRSGAPGSPQIYSDNAVIFDAGVRVRVSPYAWFFGEGGTGIGTRGQGTISDLRYGFLYSQRWGNHAFTEMDASAAIYSRYTNNFISYFTLLHEFGGKMIRPIAGFDAAADEKAIFGNNYVDGFAGVQIGTGPVVMRLITVNGTYLTRGLPAPRVRYSTFRATAIFGFSK